MQIIQGIWDELAPLHGAQLSGHRVEIRVLDSEPLRQAVGDDAFQASMVRISELTKGAALISPNPLRAEDFYESAE